MKIFFARHGQYQNPDEVSPCRLPGFPLSEAGIKQVQLQIEKLTDQKIRAIYTSPIERCLQTASLIAKSLHLFPNQESELIELKTPFQGYKKADIPSDIYQDSFHINGGGETREEVFARMYDFFSQLRQTSQNSSYLLVSHGDPIIVLLAGILKKPVRYIPMGGLVLLEYGKTKLPLYSEII